MEHAVGITDRPAPAQRILDFHLLPIMAPKNFKKWLDDQNSVKNEEMKILPGKSAICNFIDARNETERMKD